MRKLFLAAAAAFTFLATPAWAATCGAVDPATSTDQVALQADANCYAAQAASEQTQADAATSSASDDRAQAASITQQASAATQAASAAQAQHDALLAQAATQQDAADAATLQATDFTQQAASLTTTAGTLQQQAAALAAQATADLASQKARLDRIAYLKSLPPPPPPPAAGYVPAPTLDGLADIPTTDFTPGIGTGLIARGPTPTNVPDNLGAMRFICGPGQLLKDDPIVYPHQKGRSHLHQFYGNEAANADSDYASLRAHGRSTCSGPQFALNRSAYWMPAMLDGKGNAVAPDNVAVYYKRFPKSSLFCQYQRSIGGDCVMQPNGIRWIIGNNPANWNNHLGAFHWGCINPSTGATLHKVTGDTGSYPTLGDVTSFCAPGWHISLAFDGVQCWDGKNLDTPDHQSHMANAIRVYWQGHSFAACPKDHPFMTPEFRLTTGWAVLAGDDTSKWELSPDRMCPTFYPGCAAHMDLFDAWDPNQKRVGMEGCLNAVRPYNTTAIPNYASAWAFPVGQGPVSGQGGDQCNNTALSGAQQPVFGWGVNPHRIIPLDPVTGEPVQQPPLP